ncbi:16788_t:CDS:2, partial [Funneliformis mosseae]
LRGHSFDRERSSLFLMFFCRTSFPKRIYGESKALRGLSRKRLGPGDGGIDVSGVVAGIAYVIQCKNWACKIGRKVVDEFFGVVYRQKNNPIGIIVAPSGYYPGAVDAALEYGIILTDNANLVEVLLDA